MMSDLDSIDEPIVQVEIHEIASGKIAVVTLNRP